MSVFQGHSKVISGFPSGQTPDVSEKSIAPKGRTTN